MTMPMEELTAPLRAIGESSPIANGIQRQFVVQRARDHKYPRICVKIEKAIEAVRTGLFNIKPSADSGNKSIA